MIRELCRKTRIAATESAPEWTQQNKHWNPLGETQHMSDHSRITLVKLSMRFVLQYLHELKHRN